MSALDRVLCDYPLPDPRDQDREFVTRAFGGFGNDRYVITRDGRLLRQAPARPFELAPMRDVEWPIEGDIRIINDDERAGDASIEYAVRFRAGRVEWIRRVASLVGRDASMSAIEGSSVPGSPEEGPMRASSSWTREET